MPLISPDDNGPAPGPEIILHVLDHALPVLSGYSIRSHNVLRALRSHGLPVVGMAPAAAAARVEEQVDGVPYVRVPRPVSPVGALRSMVDLRRDLRRELCGRRVALLHAHTPVRTGLPALWAARQAGIPIVYELHGLWEESGVARRRMTRRSIRYRASRRVDTWLMRRVDALAAISRGLIDEAQRRGVAAQRIVHVPNGVDSRRFRPRPVDAELAARHGLTGKMVFGYIGFFFAYEGVDVLLRAFARLVAQLPHARLLLVGDGDTHDALRAEVCRLHIESRVIMTGRVSHADVPRYYSLCDVLVYPRSRGRATELVTPLRPLEAMAMGRAVVASDVGGLREIVRHGETGLLVAAGDPAGLATALAFLGTDPVARGRLCERSRRFAVEERDWSSVAGTYAALYARLLGPAGGGLSAADDRLRAF